MMNKYVTTSCASQGFIKDPEQTNWVAMSDAGRQSLCGRCVPGLANCLRSRLFHCKHVSVL